MDASSQREFLRIDQALKEKEQRGHVYLPPTGPLIITTAEGTRGRSAIIGPRPTRNAIRVALRTKELGRWAEDLKVKARGGPRVPPVIWNTRHLVVTGVTSSHALLTALRRPNEYDESDLEQLGAAAECSGRELEAAFAETTTESLPTAARRWMRPDRGGGRMSGHAPLRASEPTRRPQRRRESILTRLAEEVRADPDGDGWLRILMRGIARTWPHLEEAERREALEAAPPLSGTAWDALLAAAMEHIAWVTGYPRPAWVDDAGRFNEPPHSYAAFEKENAICWAPGAFLRHGALADPRDLDWRGGENGAWVPDREAENRGSNAAKLGDTPRATATRTRSRQS